MGAIEKELEQNMNFFVKRMNTRNGKIVEIIEDEIKGAENHEKSEYSEDYIKGYISGLKQAKRIANNLLS